MIMQIIFIPLLEYFHTSNSIIIKLNIFLVFKNIQMSSYDKTVAQWKKDNPPKTFEEIEREAKEKATQKLYNANDEYYLDSSKPEFKELFKNWPRNDYSTSVSSEDYEQALKKQIIDFKNDKTRFFYKITNKRINN